MIKNSAIKYLSDTFIECTDIFKTLPTFLDYSRDRARQENSSTLSPMHQGESRFHCLDDGIVIVIFQLNDLIPTLHHLHT